MLLLLACSERFVEDTGGAPPVSDTDTDTDTAVDTHTGDTDTAADTALDTDTFDPDRPLELCINELMPDNEASVQDDTLAYVDWIELHNPGEEPVQLDGWTLTDFRYEPDKHVMVGGLAIPPGGFQVLWADGLPETGPSHLGFRLAVDGGEIGLYAPDGRGSLVTYGEMAADFSIARVPDCCTGEGCLVFDFRGTPGVTNVEPVYEDVPLLPKGSTWKYWDAGTNPGVGWEQPGFDDSAWASGVGPLGYGDTHLLTTLSYGANASAKHVTTWLRATVEVTDPALAALTLGLLRDDGAVVYLNGVEVARDNLPEGALTDTTLASGAVGTADETTYWEFALDPAALVAGTNTLAVELHQADPTSSDLGFDLALTGSRLVTGE